MKRALRTSYALRSYQRDHQMPSATCSQREMFFQSGCAQEVVGNVPQSHATSDNKGSDTNATQRTISWNHGDAAADLHKVRQRASIVATVREEVRVDSVCVGTRPPDNASS